jgi:hypothetical protein
LDTAVSLSDNPKRVGENRCVNGHDVYFAWFSTRRKQIKRSLKTNGKAPAWRRLAELREKAVRLHGGEQRNLRFDELAKMWLESIRGDVKESTITRRGVCVNQLVPFL